MRDRKIYAIVSTIGLMAGVLAGLVPGAAQAADRPTIVLPDTPMPAGTATPIRVAGLPANRRVALELARNSPYGEPFTLVSRATFVVAPDGTVDTSRDAPADGSYQGVDAAGPFYSMSAAGKPPVAGRSAEEVSVSVDVQEDGIPDAQLTLRTTRPLPEGIAAGEALPGATLFLPTGPAGRVPAIIALGGSEGGASGSRSFVARFVERGYAVLALPYYSPGYATQPVAGLPKAFADIPIDKLELALDWLRARPEVARDRVGLIGVSKGGELALAAGSRIKGFASIAAIVPSDVIWEGWGAGVTGGQRSSFSWRGRPLPFVPYLGMAEQIKLAAQGKQTRIRTAHDAGRTAHPERVAPARIAVERIRVPLLLAGGDQDQLWNSGGMVRAMAETRAANGLATETLAFTDAGHNLSGDGTMPMSRADSMASRRTFEATVAFFARTLRPGTGLAVPAR